MQIQCPRCAQDIPTTAVNMERFIAKCDNCNSMFDISDLAADVPGQIRGKVPLPKGLVIAEDARDFVITRRWFRPFFILLVFACIFFIGFSLSFYSDLPDDMPSALQFVPIFQLAIITGLGYYTLCGLLNTTTISLSNGRLTVTHKPLPWRGQVDMEAGEIEQIYCKQHVRQTKNGESITYRLKAMLKDGSSKTLVYGLNEDEQALYLEQELEKRLNIVDQSIPGEWK